MDAEKMLYGTERATITPDHIHGSVYEKNKTQVASVMQGAFNFYYNAYQAASNIGTPVCKYPSSQKAIGNLRWAVQYDLINTANNSYVGNDLKWCFEHLAEKKGHWYDDTWNGWKGVCNIPIGVSNFLDAVEERGTAVVNNYSEWKKYTDNIRRLKELKRWDDLGTQMGYAQTAADNIFPKLWVAVGVGKDAAERHAQIMSKWVGYGMKVHGYLDLYNKVRYNPAGAQQAVMVEAAAMVVEGLPIFGSLYAGVIRGIPQVISWFKNYAAKQAQYIDMVGR